LHNYYITPEDYITAEKNGISETQLNARVRVYGWDKRRAMTQPVRKEKDRRKWAKVAEEHGVPYHTFMARVHSKGWSEEKAATTPVLTMKEVGRRRSLKKDSEYDKKYLDMARKNGISRYMFFRRVQTSGWSLEDAATIKPMTKTEASRSRRKNKNVEFM